MTDYEKKIVIYLDIDDHSIVYFKSKRRILAKGPFGKNTIIQG